MFVHECICVYERGFVLRYNQPRIRKLKQVCRENKRFRRIYVSFFWNDRVVPRYVIVYIQTRYVYVYKWSVHLKNYIIPIYYKNGAKRVV
jgi:hypothetical protein